MALWKRRVVFEVGQPGQAGISLSDLRVSFRIVHTRTADPSQATISIWNMRPETIAEFQRDGAVIRLLAGYDVPRQIFQGNAVVDGVTVEKRGTDRILTVKAQDGLIAYQSSQVDVTFDGETTLGEILREALGQLGLPQGPSTELPDVRFSDYTYHGDASGLMDRIAEMASVDWVIRDGAVVLIGEGETSGETAVLYSSAKGNLIGSPTRKDGGVEVTALLDASMRPGMPFVVESDEINGEFIAEEVTFTGDSGFAGPFYTIITGVDRQSPTTSTAPEPANTPQTFREVLEEAGF